MVTHCCQTIVPVCLYCWFDFYFHRQFDKLFVRQTRIINPALRIFIFPARIKAWILPVFLPCLLLCWYPSLLMRPHIKKVKCPLKAIYFCRLLSYIFHWQMLHLNSPSYLWRSMVLVNVLRIPLAEGLIKLEGCNKQCLLSLTGTSRADLCSIRFRMLIFVSVQK